MFCPQCGKNKKRSGDAFCSKQCFEEWLELAQWARENAERMQQKGLEKREQREIHARMDKSKRSRARLHA